MTEVARDSIVAHEGYWLMGKSLGEQYMEHRELQMHS
jgi:hypothetical protein